MLSVIGRQKRHRDFGDVALLAPKARPERRVDHSLDHLERRQRGDGVASARARGSEMFGEMRVDDRCGQLRGRITLSAQATIVPTGRSVALRGAQAEEGPAQEFH
jgi:hypothetical protein